MFKQITSILITAGITLSGVTSAFALESKDPLTPPQGNVSVSSVPNAPLGLYASNSAPGYINLSWVNPATNSSLGVTDFIIQYKKASSATWLTFSDGVSTATTAKVTGIENSTKYNFKVAAKNSSGVSAYTPLISVMSSLSRIPAAPSNVSGVANSNSSVYLTWTAPTALNGGVLNDYVIQYKLSTASTWSTWNDGVSTKTDATIGGLNANTKYQFKVASKSIYGTSAYTSLITVPTTTSYVPGSISTVIAAGDSISRGYNSTYNCVLKDCPQYAWSTGAGGSLGDPKSFFTKIKFLNTTANPTTGLNVAKTGAKVSDLDRQLKLIPTGTKTNVNIMIGANDLCTSSLSTMTTSASFSAYFETALTNYVSRNPDTKIHVSSIPNVTDLYTIFKGNTTAKTIWDKAKACPTVLSSAATDASRTSVLFRHREFNNALKNICMVKFPKNCRWDNYAVANYVFKSYDISAVDYFHPSPVGQANLAATAWKSSYWGV